MAADCTRWLEEVSDTIPSIVVRAMRGRREVDKARVFIDDEEAKLDGRPIELDPGPHQIRVEVEGSPSAEREVVAKTGVRARIVEIELPSSGNAVHDSETEPAATGGTHPVVWIAGGIGVLGLASFGYFGLRAKHRYDDLDESCAPSCKKSDSDEVKRAFLIADISLGVAALGFGTAAYFLISPQVPEPRRHFCSPDPLGSLARAARQLLIQRSSRMGWYPTLTRSERVRTRISAGCP